MKALILALAGFTCAFPLATLAWPTRPTCKYCHQPYNSYIPRILVLAREPAKCRDHCAWTNDVHLITEVHFDHPCQGVWTATFDIPTNPDNVTTLRTTIVPSALHKFKLNRPTITGLDPYLLSDLPLEHGGTAGTDLVFLESGHVSIQLAATPLTDDPVPDDPSAVFTTELFSGILK
jgi:hypothetical protein